MHCKRSAGAWLLHDSWAACLTGCKCSISAAGLVLGLHLSRQYCWPSIAVCRIMSPLQMLTHRSSYISIARLQDDQPHCGCVTVKHHSIKSGTTPCNLHSSLNFAVGSPSRCRSSKQSGCRCAWVSAVWSLSIRPTPHLLWGDQSSWISLIYHHSPQTSTTQSKPLLKVYVRQHECLRISCGAPQRHIGPLYVQCAPSSAAGLLSITSAQPHCSQHKPSIAV